MKVRAEASGSRCHIDALHAIDRVLAEQPDSIEQALVPAIRCMVRLRDETIAAIRATDAEAEARKRLHDINAALSLLVGAHYPLVGIQWDRLRKARNALADVATAR
jgi:hypothetical protein